MHYDQYTLTKNDPGVFVTRTEQFLLSFWKHHAVCCLCVCLQTKRDRGGVQQAEPSQRRGRGELVTLRASSPISLSIHPPRPPHPPPYPPASSSSTPQRDLINTRQPRRGRSCMNVRNGVKEGGG